MPPEPLTPERILAATEDVLRRYGPAKATVVDVARELGVSHGSVYRHFRTKAALREAVTERWLHRTIDDLERVVAQDAPAALRLERWLTTLFAAKRRKAGEEPELFATYSALLPDAGGAVDRHVEELIAQLARILRDGVTQGEFTDPPLGVAATARAVFDATVRFHDPAHAAYWSTPESEPAFAAVCTLLVHGLRA